VVAFVVGEVDADELRAHLRERLAGYKVPKSIERIEAIPRNAAGKILRGRLP
jgi:acyl-CoA synthetase (AMP-forming)/AMP-acid ligase II